MYEDELRSRRYYERRARWYDLANRVAALLRGVSGRRSRLQAIDALHLRPGDRVLEVAVGTGTNIALMRSAAPELSIVGVDISRAMLQRCRRKLAAPDHVMLVEGEAAHLPFEDAAFDAVLQHGGFAEFGDRAAAINEMARVSQRGGRIVLCDVAVPTDRRLSLINRLLLRLQPDYNRPPPVDLLHAAGMDVRPTWIGGGAWYLIAFVNPGKS